MSGADFGPSPAQFERILSALETARLTREQAGKQIRRSQETVARLATLLDEIERRQSSRPATRSSGTVPAAADAGAAGDGASPGVSSQPPARPAPRLDVYRDGALAATFVYGRPALYYGSAGEEVRALVERPHEAYNPWRDEIDDGARHPDDPTWWAANITGAGLGRASFELFGADLP
jgi:hypothetical protein